MSDIYLYGVSGNQLQSGCRQVLQACHAVVASKRFDPLLTGISAHRIAVTPVKDMLALVAENLRHGDVGILASGDPLFFGIGRRLIDRFGPDRIHVFPALSAMQLACARCRVPWDDLVFMSLHGRNDHGLTGRIMAHEKVMLFTDGRHSPDRIAGMILRDLEQVGAVDHLQNIRVWVGQCLGEPEEKISSGTLAEIAAMRFAPLNMMLIEQKRPDDAVPCFGLMEDEIIHSRGLITKDEVRAVILHCLRLPRQGVFWDVGGGSGSIALEAAGLAPGLDVFTIEKKNEGQANIRANICRLHRFNVRLVAGEAPAACEPLPEPERIFVGGSGGRLAAIITYGAARLRRGGIMVASAVLATTAEQAPQYMARAGLQVDTRLVAVTRFGSAGGAVRSFNPITIITGRK